MKTLPALLAVAAVLAAPAFASAATARGDMLGASPDSMLTSGPSISPTTTDPVSDSVNAEHNYLADVCPTVLNHQGSYSATLVRFCQESKS